MDHPKKLNHLSTCTGYGGIDLGFRRVGLPIHTVAYVEIEAFPIANLVKKMENGWMDVAPIWSDLKTFPYSDFYGKVDLFSGGFPCQPFSQAGHRRGSDDPRHLFPHLLKGIRELGRPSIIFFENVEGIISTEINGESVLKYVLSELEGLGYECESGIFSAEEEGGSHLRKRVFIIGTRLNQEGKDLIRSFLKGNKTRLKPPSRQGEEQHPIEPPRLITKGGCISKPKMGRDAHGNPYRLDFPKLYSDCTHREDEFKLLGNGVFPDTCARAFKVLWEKLVNSCN